MLCVARIHGIGGMVAWEKEEEKMIVSRRCAEMEDLRIREKFGRDLGAESAAVSVSFFIAQAEIETKLCV